MYQKQLLWIPVVVASALTIISIAQIDSVSAQQAGEAGVGGAGGAGGEGGGFNVGGSNGALAAHGDFVYVLDRGNLYQYAAYDLTLVKKSDLSAGMGPTNRIRRGHAGGNGGAGGPGGGGGRGGEGGGGKFGFDGGAFGWTEDVAAYGEFVYVLQGKTLRKLYANGLKPMKMVTLDVDVKVGN